MLVSVRSSFVILRMKCQLPEGLFDMTVEAKISLKTQEFHVLFFCDNFTGLPCPATSKKKENNIIWKLQEGKVLGCGVRSVVRSFC